MRIVSSIGLMLACLAMQGQVKFQQIIAYNIIDLELDSKKEYRHACVLESTRVLKKHFPQEDLLQNNPYLKRCLDTLNFNTHQIINLSGTHKHANPLKIQIEKITLKNGKMKVAWSLSNIAQGEDPGPPRKQDVVGLYITKKPRKSTSFEFKGFKHNTASAP